MLLEHHKDSYDHWSDADISDSEEGDDYADGCYYGDCDGGCCVAAAAAWLDGGQCCPCEDAATAEAMINALRKVTVTHQTFS